MSALVQMFDVQNLTLILRNVSQAELIETLAKNGYQIEVGRDLYVVTKQ